MPMPESRPSFVVRPTRPATADMPGFVAKDFDLSCSEGVRVGRTIQRTQMKPRALRAAFDFGVERALPFRV